MTCPLYHDLMTRSIGYFEIRDQMLAAIDSLWAETDPIKRFVLSEKLYADTLEEIKRVRNESAYLARLKHAIVHIERLTGTDHRTISRYVAAHLADNPQLKKPSQKTLPEQFDYIDLREILLAEPHDQTQKETPTSHDAEEECQ